MTGELVAALVGLLGMACGALAAYRHGHERGWHKGWEAGYNRADSREGLAHECTELCTPDTCWVKDLEP